ncbi:hypothetical protein TMatcc_000439 [Talaromyces marneffei ATCC 18224]|uniref:uncharacterized protein n=1 Tax=Talaromyces marneffei TaxID=37727 RepID=UPI0012A92F01|nr:uncharacterized protein EYB26_003023 [Talaromyces marneffei]KAE8549438.1 hypothetical protein EYB25_007959 [Talaromyces marneffei]QGA15366.1 hypothetical protein EYB26_003023 [Talaromyces marneffei]
MRSGLQSPGAVPLLAVLVAALLSITPNLCESWMKPGSSPSIEDYEAESSIYSFESGSTISPPSVVSAPSIISTITNIDLLWQQVCQVTTSILSSYKHPLSYDCSSQQIPKPVENSSEPHPITQESTPITISLESMPQVVDKHNSTEPFSGQNSPSDQLEKSARVNSSSPVDSKGSYMAILVSLVVAIMWF